MVLKSLDIKYYGKKCIFVSRNVSTDSNAKKNSNVKIVLGISKMIIWPSEIRTLSLLKKKSKDLKNQKKKDCLKELSPELPVTILNQREIISHYHCGRRISHFFLRDNLLQKIWGDHLSSFFWKITVKSYLGKQPINEKCQKNIGFGLKGGKITPKTDFFTFLTFWKKMWKMYNLRNRAFFHHNPQTQ